MNQVLSYQELFFAVRENLGVQLSPELHITTGSRVRSGGRRVDTIEIRRDGERFGRIFYADDMYMQYLQGAPPAEVAEQVAQMCEGGMPCEPMSVLDYRQASKRLLLRLENYERNRERLEDFIYRRFLDLALTCRVMIPTSEDVLRSAPVSPALLGYWGVSEEEVFEQAKQCMTENEVPVLRPLRDILREMAPEGEEIPEGGCDLYVLTTKRGFSGASALLVSGFAEELSERLQRDILALPSSVHEVLLLPDWGDWKVDALRSIVEDVNRNVVPAEDFLSDNVYRYRLDEHRFVIDS